MFYPYTKCEHPRRVYNRYTHEPLLVGCGHCRPCLVTKADRKAFQCSVEESDHKYCMFVTLTYSDKYLPKCRVEKDEEGNLVLRNYCNRNGYNSICVDASRGIIDYIPKCDYDVYTDGFLSLLYAKVNLGGYLGYANVRDLQLFLKRFRKELKKYSYEKVRYYAVSEYGPVHFRPHFHILFFFDEERTFKNFRQVLCKVWTFGRVDSSLSRGKCSSYVSSYVNSFVGVPSVYKIRAVRPFCCHSIGFAKSYYKSKAKEIYENGFASFMQLCKRFGKKSVRFSPWRSLKGMLYPRCVSYGIKSFSVLYYSYTVLSSVERQYGKGRSISEYVDMIYDDVTSCDVVPVTVLDYYFRSSLQDSKVDSYKSRIASELYISKHFFDFCVPNMFPSESSSSVWTWFKAVRMIKEFYDFYALNQLNQMYQDQITYYEQYKSVNGFPFFYSNFPCFVREELDEVDTLPVDDLFGVELFNEKMSNKYGSVIEHFLLMLGMSFYTFVYSQYDQLDSLPLYKSFYTYYFNRYERCIKHKKLNDLNRIFCI